jgi:hypothetical protein
VGKNKNADRAASVPEKENQKYIPKLVLCVRAKIKKNGHHAATACFFT